MLREEEGQKNGDTSAKEDEKDTLHLNIFTNDLSEKQTEDAMDISRECIRNCKTEKDFATKMKKEFEAKHEGTWQVICGVTFGCSLTHKTKSVLHFQIQYTDQYQPQKTNISNKTIILFQSA